MNYNQIARVASQIGSEAECLATRVVRGDKAFIEELTAELLMQAKLRPTPAAQAARDLNDVTERVQDIASMLGDANVGFSEKARRRWENRLQQGVREVERLSVLAVSPLGTFTKSQQKVRRRR